MKPPKNFYSNLDRRKQGFPEVPEASAADVGKIIKVGEDGAYELGTEKASGSTIKIYDVTVSGNNYSLANGKTYNDILNDINNNNIVYLRRYLRELFPLSTIPREGSVNYIRFVMVSTNGSAITVENIDVASNNRITHSGKDVS